MWFFLVKDVYRQCDVIDYFLNGNNSLFSIRVKGIQRWTPERSRTRIYVKNIKHICLLFNIGGTKCDTSSLPIIIEWTYHLYLST